MCSGVRSVEVLKTFLPKLFYFRYLNPLTPFEERYGNIEIGKRGGIRVPGGVEKVVPEPE